MSFQFPKFGGKKVVEVATILDGIFLRYNGILHTVSHSRKNGCVVGTLDFFVAFGFSNFKRTLIKAFHSLEPFRRLWKLDCKVTFILGGNFFQPTEASAGNFD
jgi:hypothetical protein